MLHVGCVTPSWHFMKAHATDVPYAASSVASLIFVLLGADLSFVGGLGPPIMQLLPLGFQVLQIFPQLHASATVIQGSGCMIMLLLLLLQDKPTDLHHARSLDVQ